jgi:hypothetical protein
MCLKIIQSIAAICINSFHHASLCGAALRSCMQCVQTLPTVSRRLPLKQRNSVKFNQFLITFCAFVRDICGRAAIRCASAGFTCITSDMK